MAKLIILFITAFVDMVGFVIVLPLLPYYAKAFGANAVSPGCWARERFAFCYTAWSAW